jgi:hypothetical protein
MSSSELAVLSWAKQTAAVCHWGMAVVAGHGAVRLQLLC